MANWKRVDANVLDGYFGGIADKIREKTGSEATYTPEEMPNGVNEAFEAGKQSAYDEFWDIFQNNGGEVNYYYALAYGRFTDENYNPIHDIVCQSGTNTASQYMFYNASEITDTKVAIYANGNALTYAFNGCTKLHTIRKLVVHKNLSYSSSFKDCSELVNMIVEGEIGKNGLDMRDSRKLSHDSIVSIINALSSTTSGLSITLSLYAVSDAFETIAGRRDGTTSDEWLALIATKTNWTINLV